MPPNYLHQLTNRLDAVFKSVDTVENEEVKAHLARYLCVLTSGYLEEAIKILIKDYVSTRTHQNVTNYVNTEVKNLTNFKTEKIENLLSCFSGDWRNKFIDQITEEEKDAIDSVVANRHIIAHGQNVGVSYVRVKEWYICTKRVVEKIRIILN